MDPDTPIPRVHQTRDSIEDIWGQRIPYKHEWPTRVDERRVDDVENWVQSACVLCSNGCGCDIGVKAGKIVGIRGRAVDRVNKGRLGPKGLHAWVSNNHKERLQYPMIRRNGKLERASWDDAMSLVVKKAKDVIDRLTAHGIGFYTTGQLFLEEYYTLALIGKAGLNTLHMDGNTRLCTATAAASLRESFGSDGQPGSYTDIDYTDCILLVGHNIAETQTVLWSRILDRLEGIDPPKVIVIDPRQSITANRATVHLAPRVGTNMAVLNGIQHLLFKNKWVNEEWVSEHTIGVEELKEKVERYNPKFVEEITGIPVEQLEKAAKFIGTTRSLLSTALQGVYQSNQATASACQINNLHLLRGLIGKPGNGIYQMNGQPTAQNNRETGCDGEFPGFRNHLNPNHMQELADIWNIEYEKIPHWNEPTHIQNMLKYIEAGSIQMFWISGTNPLVSLPNLPLVRDLLSQTELFVVVQDIFLTETAAIADVVLPAAQWGEKTGCFTNVDRTVHISFKAIEPPGEAKSDFDIFLDFAKRMDFRDKDGKFLLPWKSTEDAFNAWKLVSKGRPCDYSGLTYEKLTGGSGIQWPCDEDRPFGSERLFEDGKFFTDIEYCESYGHDLETGAPLTKEQYMVLNPAGRAILKAAHYVAPQEGVDDEYPLQLSTGRQVFHFHTRTKTGRAIELKRAAGRPFIQIADEDAERFGVKDGQDVIVESRRGRIQLPLKVGRIAAGQVFIPFHYGYWDSDDERARAANELTQERWDPISKQPMFKSGAVRIQKLPIGEVQIHAKQQQAVAEDRVYQTKRDAEEVAMRARQSRYLESYIATTYKAVKLLIKICDEVKTQFQSDNEIQAGMSTMQRLADSVESSFEPMTRKYPQEDAEASTPEQTHSDGKGTSGCETLMTLQGLWMHLGYLESHFIVLQPTSQALWDGNFVKSIAFCLSQLARMQAWVKQQMKVRSPQTLLVPTAT